MMNLMQNQVKKIIEASLSSSFEDDWVSIDQYIDINLWQDDDEIKHITVYPVIDGKTITTESFIDFSGHKNE